MLAMRRWEFEVFAALHDRPPPLKRLLISLKLLANTSTADLITNLVGFESARPPKDHLVGPKAEGTPKKINLEVNFKSPAWTPSTPGRSIAGGCGHRSAKAHQRHTSPSARHTTVTRHWRVKRASRPSS
jgi:hypothetical protein